jgi:hypothetical protein
MNMSNNQKIVRTKDYASGPLTEEEKVAIAAHTEKWIGYVKRTESIEPDIIVPAIRSLYKAAKQPPVQVIIVSSPLVMAAASAFASVLLDKKDWTMPAIPQDALDDAQVVGICNAVGAAVMTPHAISSDVRAQAAPDKIGAIASAQKNTAIRRAAKILAVGDAALFNQLLSEMPNWWRLYQGGNMWAAWDCYLTAMRDIIGISVPAHGPYKAWEMCAIHGSFRVVHEKFCIISDFPDRMNLDAEMRAHCEDGPSNRWRDGYAMYHWHGVRAPSLLIEHPELITVDQITNETNAELRRVYIERYGTARYLIDAGAREVHKDRFGILYIKDEPDDEPIAMVRVLNSTPEPEGSLTRDEALAIFSPATRVQAGYTAGAAFDSSMSDEEVLQSAAMMRLDEADPSLRFKEYMIPVHHELRPLLANNELGEPQRTLTARNAVASTFGMTGDEYDPEFES